MDVTVEPSADGRTVNVTVRRQRRGRAGREAAGGTGASAGGGAARAGCGGDEDGRTSASPACRFPSANEPCTLVVRVEHDASIHGTCAWTGRTWWRTRGSGCTELVRRPTWRNSKRALWASGAAYESYVGRWSRLVASEFLDWLAGPAAVKLAGRWMRDRRAYQARSSKPSRQAVGVWHRSFASIYSRLLASM